MTIFDFANMLDGRQRCKEITRQEEQTAKGNGFIVIYSASDDLCELAGAISDEIDCFDGGKFYLYNGRVLSEDECADENYCVKAVWRPYYENCSWAYETSLPYAKFKIYEDDELYCIGIVIDITCTYYPEEICKRLCEVSLAGGISCQDINDAFSLFQQAVGKRPKAVQCQHCGINISMENENLQWHYSLSVARWKGVFCLCDNCFDKLHEFLFPQKNSQL